MILKSETWTSGSRTPNLAFELTLQTTTATTTRRMMTDHYKSESLANINQI